MTDDETREEAVERKGYPYEVPDILKGPCREPSATSAAIEKCSCPESEVYRKALEEIAHDFDRDGKSRTIAAKALASVVPPPRKPCSCRGAHPEWEAHSADGCGVTMAHAVAIGGQRPWL